MYHQTDKRVSIIRNIKGEEVDVMRKWGCLYASLLFVIEQAMGRYFSPSQVRLLYDYLIKINALRRDMYVKNHIKVIENGCRILGYEPKEVKYIAHVDYEKEEETWGNMKGYTHILNEDRINANTVHFYHDDFNPYPNLKGKLISHRYYRIVV